MTAYFISDSTSSSSLKLLYHNKCSYFFRLNRTIFFKTVFHYKQIRLSQVLLYFKIIDNRTISSSIHSILKKCNFYDCLVNVFAFLKIIGVVY